MTITSNNHPSNEKTEIYYGEEATNAIAEGMLRAKKKVDMCVDTNAPSVGVLVTSLKNAKMEAAKKGIKIRYITEITKDNTAFCKELAKFVDLRHLDGVKGNFGVSENEYMAVTTLREAKPVTKAIYSNIREIVEEHQYFFETLWDKAIPAEQKIREIEEGIPFQQIDVIGDTNQSLELYKNLVKSSTEEIMLLFPTVNAVVRQAKAGIMHLINDSVIQRSVRVKMLLPDHELTRSSTAELETTSNQNNIAIRFIEHEQGGKATMLIVDSEKCLMMELRDDSTTTFHEAIGLSTYTNSRAGVLSYVSMFESLWRQTELYEKIKEHDKIQQEFINIAAHELRTPVQPLLSVAEMLMSELEGEEKQQKKIIQVPRDNVEMIIRNVKRLERLTSDVLEASKIEGNALRLHEEIIDLNEKIRNVVNDVRRSIPKGKKLSIIFDQKEISPILVKGDKTRLFRVLSNIIGNAIKFTDDGGSITITAERNAEKKEALVTIRDTGKGIDPEILPRLFTKFTSKSDIGTGLGLYLSRGIIEAHGGKIWAENNKDGTGATFAFSIPLMD